jgi:hypothetical protein
MIEKQSETPHGCQCSHCVKDPSSSIAELHCQINQLVALLNEKERRQLVGLLARQLGQGGVTLMAQVTGLSRTTIRRGQAELLNRETSDRIRTKGGGRPRVEKKRLGC